MVAIRACRLHAAILCTVGTASFAQDVFLKKLAPQPALVGLKIINNCNEDIDLRTPHLDRKGDDDSDGDYETIPANGEKTFAPGMVKGNKVVLAWKDAAHTPCYNGVFCTQIELSTSNQDLGMRTCDQPNFVNQLAFTDMPIGAAFFRNGAPHPECPQSQVQQCNTKQGWCTTTRGKFDKCMHRADACSEDVGWDVKLDKQSPHRYCLSPDINKAVISAEMVNPSKATCASPVNSSRWLCKGLCADLTKSRVGTTDTLCGPRWDMVHAIQDDGLKLFSERSQGAQLTSSDLIDNNDFGGAKSYQATVNRACGNQPPSQRAKTAPDGRIVEGWAPEYDRSYEQQGHLDHAITWEGDDVNMRELKVQKYVNRGLFMAGSGGMICDASDDWDTFVIKACPTQAD